jgi:hypothetical protein
MRISRSSTASVRRDSLSGRLPVAAFKRAIQRQADRPRRPPLRSGRSAVQARSARRQVIAVKAAHAGASQEGASP